MELTEILLIRDGRLYAGKEVIINNIDMSLTSGEFCYLYGVNGSGKSAFFKAILKLEELDGTEINILGYDIRNLQDEALQNYRKQIGLISNFYPLIGDKTVFENLEIILKTTGWKAKTHRDEAISELLKFGNMTKRTLSLAGELSVGEQVIIKILRAVLNKPKLILADGITALLDNHLSEQILNLLRELALKNGSTVILATHRRELIEQYPARTYICEHRSIHEI